MRYMIRRHSGITLLILACVAAVPIGTAAAKTKPPFEPHVVQLAPEGLFGNVAVERPGHAPGFIAAALPAADAIVLIRADRAGPQAGERYAVGHTPMALAAGDLDRDGRADLVVLNFGSADLSILLARPGSGFAGERRQPLPHALQSNDLHIGAERSMTLADFDADGCPDLALATRVGVESMRGDCRGGFVAIERVTAGDFPFSLVSGDLDGDGRIDLAASAIASDQVVVLLGRGDGTFSPRPGVTAGITPYGLAAGDLDRDGVLDLVTANIYSGDPIDPAGDVSILLGAGGGTFRPPVRYRAGRGTFSVVLGDLDGDGDLDIAAANNDSGDASIFIGRGDGTFDAQRRARVGLGPHALLVVDQDRDGVLDLAAALAPGDMVFVSGLGDGTFASPGLVPDSIQPHRLAAADLDGDGRPDLVVAGRRPGTGLEDVAVLPGLGGGRFAPAITLDALRDWADVSGLAVGDFDEDGRGDLVLSDAYDSVTVLLGRPGWAFTAPVATTTALEPRALAVADFNGDRHLDLAVAHGGTNGVIILLGRGDGGLDAGVTLPGGDLADIAAADFDGDGRIDLAAAGFLPDPVVSWRNVALVWRGAGDGSFGAPLTIDIEGNAAALAVGDVDGDRRPDLAVATTYTVTLFRNLGGLAFAPGTSSDAGIGMGALVAADVTSDGLDDVTALDARGEYLAVLAGTRGGTLAPAVRTIAGKRPAALATADFDGDGAPDLATADAGETDAFLGARPDVALSLNRGQAPDLPARGAGTTAIASPTIRAVRPVRVAR